MPSDAMPAPEARQPASAHRLREIFGFSAFRPGQAEVIGALSAGRPALAIFPTGGGKSLCYQLPALDFSGLTLVISPLIALMKDQVDQLQRLGVAAAKLDSSLSRDEALGIYDSMASGELKLLYVAPERLGNEGFRARLRRTQLAMIAIDEAHCISQWGHNFRPDYLKIAAFAEELRVRRVLALTATATPAVAADIRAAFGIDEADHIQTGFHRPNLTLRVHRAAPAQRDAKLVARLRAAPTGSSIVYVTLQKTAERVAEMLCAAGLRAQAYHAGLKPEVRSRLQDAFMAGEVPIMVATIAFGMGIDKADIRAVLHYNLPKSLESYSQEIGRAGRDGQPSRCELFACAEDQLVLDNFSYGDTPTRGALAGMAREVLCGERVVAVSRYHLSKDHDMRPLVVSTVLTYLELDGLLRATGPFYAGYKVRFATSQADVVARYSGERAAFVQAVFSAGKMGRTWLTLEPDVVAAELGQPVARVRAVITYSEQQGHIETKPSGLRHGYERRSAAPLSEAELATVVAGLEARFAAREASDIARTAEVLAFAERDDCLTRALVSYFGEQLPGPCGHCGPCLGEPQPSPHPTTPRATAVDARLSEAEQNLLAEVRAEGHPALAEPRALTRFLCGLRSPATQARTGRGPALSRDRRFGRLGHLPFLTVLAAAEQA